MALVSIFSLNQVILKLALSWSIFIEIFDVKVLHVMKGDPRLFGDPE